MKYVNILIAALTLLLFGCDGATSKPQSSDVQQKNQTEQLMSEAQRQVGMPAITNFQEKKLSKYLYELRDREDLITYTYIVNMHGDLIFLGKSIGYGLPYSVQFSNPMRIWDLESEGGARNKYEDNGEIQVLPQPEPNGLFMPEGLSATWILLIDEETGETRPVYVEPEIIVSPIPLRIGKMTE